MGINWEEKDGWDIDGKIKCKQCQAGVWVRKVWKFRERIIAATDVRHTHTQHEGNITVSNVAL